MGKMLWVAIRATAVTWAVTALAYPLVVTGLAQLMFPDQANGSLVRDERSQVVGSALLGQTFTSEAYFQPRPSAAGANGYDAMASGGSNAGPSSRKLEQRMKDDVTRLKKENPDAPASIPAQLVTASGSGLDPHLSPEAAAWQVARVARARHLSADRVSAVMNAVVEGRELGFLGEPRVNVLLLNLALDRHFGRPP